jgi:phosphatidylserine/phosphatidylglycerophosphate/cardiolipin synthase-like enzyme
VTATFLSDGGQSAASVAALLASFLAAARRTLDVAIYDLAPGGVAAGVLARAFLDARGRGVRVRLLFNQEPRRRRKLLPPPGFVDWGFLHRLALETRAVPGAPDLMHHKYAVRDAEGQRPAVWTGSTNWTTSSWTREENVIVRVDHAAIAAAYAANFQQLWDRPLVAGSGGQPATWRRLGHGLQVRAHFAPGGAQELVHQIARRIGEARRRLRICSPVLSSGPVLGTLAEVVRRPGLEVSGCYDLTQMTQVERRWRRRPGSAWKLAAWRAVRGATPWGAKRSRPYQAGQVHDFMHAKCVVADDVVFVGSYNLSHSGEANAENVLEIESRPLADAFSAYVSELAVRYA